MGQPLDHKYGDVSSAIGKGTEEISGGFGIVVDGKWTHGS